MWRRQGWSGRRPGEVGLELTPTSVITSAKELDVGGDDLGHAAHFAFLVLVAVVLQPPLNGGRVTLVDVFLGRLGQPIPADNGVKLGLFLALDCAVGGQADGRDGFAVLGVPQLGIASGVADVDSFVDAAHPSIVAVVCKKYV